MKHRLLFLSVAALLIAFFTLSCSKKTTEPLSPDDEPIKAEETVVLSTATANSIIDVSENQIIFPSGTDSSIYQVGNVITAAPTTAAPHGLLRKVVSHSTQGNQVVVNTAIARLEDAFDQLDLSITQNLKTSDIETSRSLIDGIIFKEDTKNPYNFSYTIDEDFDLGSNIILNIDGELSLTLGYDFRVKINVIRGLHYINFESFVTSNGDLALTVNGSFSYERSIDLYEHYFSPAILFAGGVPIVLVPKVVVILNIDAAGQASVTTSVSTSASFSAAVVYDKPSWTNTQDRELDFSYSPPSLSADMNATIDAGPRLEINLYGIAGPWVHGKGVLDLNANISETPWWTLTGGFAVDAGVKFEALGYVANHSIPNIINHSTVLAQAAQNQVATPSFSPPGGSYESAQNVSINCASSGATIRYTTNGSEPTETSTQYSATISVSTTTTIKARAFRNGWTPSSIASATYTIGGGTPGQMVLVPGGTFTMGRTTGSGYSDELPPHSVTLNSFYMGKYEVTQAEYAQYMQPGSNWTSNYGLGDNYPAYYVSWYAILKYCNLRSIAEGLTPVYTISGSTDPANWGAVPTSSNYTWNSAICNFSANGYRLPTEAEWEYAARGATNTPDYLYSGSDDINAVAWYDGNNNPIGSKPVGAKAPNGLGLYDMSGNVWEWCWDWYGNIYYLLSLGNNPTGPVSGSDRVPRGGSWYVSAPDCRVARRGYYGPSGSSYGIGFRLCRAVL